MTDFKRGNREGMPKINARVETTWSSGWTGTTTASIKRVEREDDGSFTVVLDPWAPPAHPAEERAVAYIFEHELWDPWAGKTGTWVAGASVAKPGHECRNIEPVYRASKVGPEDCAKIADALEDEAPTGSYDNGGTIDGWQMACRELAKRIRALSRARTWSEAQNG